MTNTYTAQITLTDKQVKEILAKSLNVSIDKISFFLKQESSSFGDTWEVFGGISISKDIELGLPDPYIFQNNSQ